MAPLWEAERTVEPDVALDLVRAQFPDIPCEKIQALGTGWDNTAYLVDGQFVFRFPRRAIAVPLLEFERNTLPRIADRLPLLVPVPEWFGVPTDEFPWPFSGYRFLPGETACELKLTDSERIDFAPFLAQFLKALHAVPEAEGRQYGLDVDKVAKLDVEKRVAQLSAFFDDEINKHLSIDFAALRRLVRQIFDANPSSMKSPSVVVHGDFYVRHLLCNSQRALHGVLDWGDLHVGCRAVDLSIVYTFLPPAGREIFYREYGQVDADTIFLAKMRALNYGCILTNYGRDIGDPALQHEGLRALQYGASEYNQPS